VIGSIAEAITTEVKTTKSISFTINKAQKTRHIRINLTMVPVLILKL